MLALLAIWLVLAAAWPAAAEEPVYIEADHVVFDQATQTYTATGNVRLSRGEDWLEADQVVFLRTVAIAEAQGNLHGWLENNELWGERGWLNLETKTGQVENGRIFVPENNYFIRGQILEKRGDQKFRASRATITTCLGERPAWSFAARRVDLTLDGYALVHHPRFRIKNVPVIYAPFFILPAKKERQTGFLTPRPGTSSLDGLTLDVPFFWAISESSDATLYASYKSNRGLMSGVEYRYILSDQSQGALWASYLDDKLGDEEFRALDNVPRDNRRRWWVRGKIDQALPANFFLRSDIDLVSDQDYLREFADGPQGFNATNAYLFRAFGRSLQEETDQVRETSVVVSRGWGPYFLSAEGRYFQDLNTATDELALQRAPSVLFEMARNPLLGSPLYLALRSQYDHLWRAADPERAPTGQRLDLQPTLSLPLTFGHYANWTPSVSVRETLYLAEGRQDGRDVGGFQHRELYALASSLSTEVARVFRAEGERFKGLKHLVRPELNYTYIPEVDQSGLPNFDSLDRQDRVNVLNMAVTNDFIGKFVNGKAASYPRLARLRFSDGINFNRLEDLPGQPARPLLPFLGELEMAVGSFALDTEAEWDWYESAITRLGLLAGWSDRRGDSVALDYRFVRDVSHEVNLNATVAVNPDLLAYTIQRLSLETGQQVESTFGVRYTSQCWSVDVHYTSEPWDDRVVVMFTLGGIGELGAFGFSPAALMGGGVSQ